MIRNSMTVLAAVVLGASFAVTACENASDKERKADQAKIEADQKKIEAQNNADQKGREAEQKAADQKAQADQKFTMEKNDYTDKLHKDLADLDKKVDDMKDATSRANGATKDAYSKTLRDVQAKRDVISADLDEIGRTTATNWDGLKAKVDKDLDDYKSTVRTASSRIKTPSSSRDENMNNKAYPGTNNNGPNTNPNVPPNQRQNTNPNRNMNNNNNPSPTPVVPPSQP